MSLNFPFFSLTLVLHAPLELDNHRLAGELVQERLGVDDRRLRGRGGRRGGGAEVKRNRRARTSKETKTKEEKGTRTNDMIRKWERKTNPRRTRATYRHHR